MSEDHYIRRFLKAYDLSSCDHSYGRLLFREEHFKIIGQHSLLSKPKGQVNSQEQKKKKERKKACQRDVHFPIYYKNCVESATTIARMKYN